MEAPENSQVNPPYIPLMTLDNFASKLKSTVVPPVIDASLTKNLSGGMAGALMSALRFLGLIEPGGKVLPPLKELVAAHGSETYPTVLGAIIDAAYADIIGDLDLTSATPAMLDEKFRKNSKANGQVLDKAVRFYLAALEKMKRPISPHFKTRKPRVSGPRKPSKNAGGKPDADRDETQDEPSAFDIPEGMQKIELPLIGKANVILALPTDFDSEDWKFLEPILKKYIERLVNLDLIS